MTNKSTDELDSEQTERGHAVPTLRSSMTPASLASFVPYWQARIAVPLEVCTLVALPILFAWAVRLRVYARFPASLFRWIMLVDAAQAAFRIVQWAPWVGLSEQLAPANSSLRTCQAVVFIDSCLQLLSLLYTTAGLTPHAQAAA